MPLPDLKLNLLLLKIFLAVFNKFDLLPILVSPNPIPFPDEADCVLS